MQKLIVVTGPDGAGKSTLMDGLAARLHGCHQAGIWDALEQGALFQSKRAVDNYLCMLTPDARLLFLAHALRYALDKAMETNASIVFFNSYYYKYFASEMALGASNELVQSLIKSFRVPDLVLYLKLSPEAAAERKKVLSRYECGLSEQPDAVSFVRFQTEAAGKWSHMEQNNFVELDARLAPEILLENAVETMVNWKVIADGGSEVF